MLYADRPPKEQKLRLQINALMWDIAHAQYDIDNVYETKGRKIYCYKVVSRKQKEIKKLEKKLTKLLTK
jgi:hypothetical protein